MAANLTSVVMQFLTPEVVGQIASFLGLDKTATQKAAAGTVPALLAGLSDLVATPAGTGQLSKLLSQQQVGSPTDLLRNVGAQGFAESGSSMLSGLFGGRTMDTMAQAVGKFTGTGESGGKLLLSVLGPIVLGALGQHQRSAGLDADGVASLLRSQKDQIVAAIPSGLADQLGAAGLIDKIAGAPGRISTAAANSALLNRAAHWLGALIVLGGLAWYATERPGQQTVAELPNTMQSPARTVGVAPPDLTVDGVNLAGQINSSVNTLKSALPGITDVATAQAALPKINEAVAQLNDISARAAKLSPEGRSALAKLIIVVRPSINQMCDKVIAIPDVGAVAKPAIDDLQARLDALARV
jgi:peptidoglycan hydrolase-like protein with peptidoglycan-binding domain